METKTVETKHGDFLIKIMQDGSPLNPRKDWDPLGTMICWHRRYDLGDDHNYDDTHHLFADIAGVDRDEYEDRGYELKKLAEEKAIILPLYLYDHSGITMSTGSFSCPWDSGQVGWIYIRKDDENYIAWGKQKEWLNGRTLEQAAIDALTGEVETYDQYLTGDVYGFKVLDPEGEEIHSCWGYFGYDHDESGLMDEATNAIECEVERMDEKENEKLEEIGCQVYGEHFNTIKL